MNVDETYLEILGLIHNPHSLFPNVDRFIGIPAKLIYNNVGLRANCPAECWHIRKKLLKRDCVVLRQEL